MLTILTRFKAWLITAGVFVLTVLTLGGYARSQKRRAEKAEQERDEAKRQIEYAEQIRQREHAAKKKNNEQRVIKDEQKRKRSYFDSLN